jgi:hypothetical protein
MEELMSTEAPDTRVSPGPSGRAWTAPLALALLAAFVPSGCTDVTTTYQQDARLARPERVHVYDFAVSPDQVRLDRGLGAQVEEAMKGSSRTAQEIDLGAKVAKIISTELADRISAMGLPAQRAVGAPGVWADSLVIEGQILSIDQGNRTERVVIGLGTGRSDVETHVQVYAATPERLERIQEFATSAKSMIKPGMAETMGVGGAAGSLAASAAVSAASAVGGETFADNVEGEAKRTAKAIADKLQAYFAQQGWIAPR